VRGYQSYEAQCEDLVNRAARFVILGVIGRHHSARMIDVPGSVTAAGGNRGTQGIQQCASFEGGIHPRLWLLEADGGANADEAGAQAQDLSVFCCLGLFSASGIASVVHFVHCMGHRFPRAVSQSVAIGYASDEMNGMLGVADLSDVIFLVAGPTTRSRFAKTT
jgi:hypothetical protein